MLHRCRAVFPPYHRRRTASALRNVKKGEGGGSQALAHDPFAFGPLWCLWRLPLLWLLARNASLAQRERKQQGKSGRCEDAKPKHIHIVDHGEKGNVDSVWSSQHVQARQNKDAKNTVAAVRSVEGPDKTHLPSYLIFVCNLNYPAGDPTRARQGHPGHFVIWGRDPCQLSPY